MSVEPDLGEVHRLHLVARDGRLVLLASTGDWRTPPEVWTAPLDTLDE